MWCGPLLFAGALLAPGPRPENPPVLPGMSIEDNVPVPGHIQRLLEQSCMDCHSNRTRWPWYSKVPPVSWMVHSDVARARRAMNLSEWGVMAPRLEVGAAYLAAACADVQSGRMPKRQYLWLHPSARLSPEERRQFCDWTEGEISRVVQTRRGAAAGQ